VEARAEAETAAGMATVAAEAEPEALAALEVGVEAWAAGLKAV
jgi:hypothetical protein